MKFKFVCEIDVPNKGSGSCDIDLETTPDELSELLKSHSDSLAALLPLFKEMNNGNAQAHQ